MSLASVETQISGANQIEYAPRNPSGATPMTVNVRRLRSTDRPTMARSPAKRRCQVR
jgi:hypothetical protein